jgi:hypothetical protein
MDLTMMIIHNSQFLYFPLIPYYTAIYLVSCYMQVLCNTKLLLLNQNVLSRKRNDMFLQIILRNSIKTRRANVCLRSG